MSARVSLEPHQGLVFCAHGGRHERPPPFLTPGGILSPQRAGTFLRLVATKTRFRLHSTPMPMPQRGFIPQGEPIRSNRLSFDDPDDECWLDEELLGSSSLAYAQSSDVRNPGNGHHGSPPAGDVASRDGFGEELSAPISDDCDPLESQVAGLDDDLDYYVPVSGHRVVGVVVSGNHAKLEVDIGASKLGHLHVQDLLTLDKLDIEESKWSLPDDAGDGGSPGTPSLGRPHALYDNEVYNYQAPQPLVVDVGTVLEMEVVGTMSENPLLSTRRATERIQWDRVMQIKAENEPIQVKILNFNKSGVITTIEGLRAFLPRAELLKKPDTAKGRKGESPEAYVGKTLWVTIPYARETGGDIILSEKDAWIKQNLQVGSLLNGTVIKIFDFGALVQVDETYICGMIHKSKIAAARIDHVSDVFEVGEKVKVIMVKSPIPDRLAFSTALLESEPGLMLRDKERVFREAEQRAIALWDEHPEWKEPTDDGAEDGVEMPTSEAFSKPISNLEWLEFLPVT